jgi:hypothetical protein
MPLFAIRECVQCLVFRLSYRVAMLLVLDVESVYALISGTPVLRIHALHIGVVYSIGPSKCTIVCMCQLYRNDARNIFPLRDKVF